MLGLMGVISISSDKKDAIICMDKMYRDAVVAKPWKLQLPPRKTRKERRLAGMPVRNSGSAPLRSVLHRPIIAGEFH